MAKKKIIFIINNFWIGGVEKLILDLATGLSTTHEVGVITVLGSGPLEPGFGKIPVNVYHASPVLFANKKFPFKLFWLVAAPLTFVRLVVFLIKVKPDIVITSLYQADILGGLGAFLAGTKKRILIQHDVQKFGVFRKYFKYFFALNLATNIIAVSNTVSKFLTSFWHIPQGKITTIYNGINIQKFSEAIKPFNAGELVFGVIGRLEPVKGHIHAMEALKILKDEYKLEPRVIVAGGGSLEKQLKEYVKKNLLERVEFIGAVADAPPFFKLVDICIVPSLEEGFGLVVLESLMAKKVVLASDIEVFKELIHSGKNGILFKVKSAESLAHELGSLVKQPELVEKYMKNTDLWISQTGYQYDINYVLNQYRKII